MKKYLSGAKDKKIGMTVKGCDLMGLYELSRRNEIDMNNLLTIGVNCGGTVSPVSARKMIREKFGVDPDNVHKEEIDKGQFIIEYEGGHKGISIDELEEEGYGRRSNCRRCKLKVPRQADLACGNWGVIGDKAGKATFVEVCSPKGADLLNKAIKSGALVSEPANPKGIEIRGKVENAMLKSARNGGTRISRHSRLTPGGSSTKKPPGASSVTHVSRTAPCASLPARR